jgi:uncharacterized protein DUF1572
MAMWQACRDDIILSFQKLKDMAEKAIKQVDQSAGFFAKPGEFSNSIAIIVKHLAGNLQSRWTNFLTSDGEKLNRDRDAEFIITEADTRPNLMAAWQAGWAALFQTLASLGEGDLEKTVLIRGEKHSVFQAIHRSLTHTAYHVGQIVYLCRLVQKDGWEWITIPPGQSSKARKYLG